MMKANKCYVCAKEFHCSAVYDEANELYIFQFGDGELVDKDGDSYFVYCEFDIENKREIVQLWYEDDVITIYDSFDLEQTLIILTERDLEEVLREFHRIFEIKEEK